MGKAATGKDWKPAAEPKKEKAPAKAASPPKEELSGPAAEIDGKIKAQGDKVRQLKTDKADKAAVDAAVKELLALKGEFKAATGKDWKPAAEPKKEKAGKENKQPAGGA